MCILIQRYFIMFAPEQKLGKISTVKVFTVEWGVGWVSEIVKPGFGMGQGNVWWVWWGYGHLLTSFLIVIYCGRLHQVVWVYMQFAEGPKSRFIQSLE